MAKCISDMEYMARDVRGYRLKLDFLTEATLRITSKELGIEEDDFREGLGLILEDVGIGLAKIEELMSQSVKSGTAFIKP